MDALRHFLLALQFFTRIPVTGRLAGWVGFSPALLRASAAHFPGVGGLIGLCAAGVGGGLLWALQPGIFAPLVAAVLSTAATVLLTGALHEDGLADVADGLGGAPDRNRALSIMKDSRVGAFGVLALVLALLAKVSLLALIGATDGRAFCVGLVLAHVVSRAWPLLLIRLMRHVGDVSGSTSKPLADQISGASLAAGLAWLALALGVGAWAQGPLFLVVPVAASLVTLLAMARLFWRRLQGYTGDCLGATQQVCEIAFYLGLALALEP